MLVQVAEPAGAPAERGRTHLVATIAGHVVLACSGRPAGAPLSLTAERAAEGIACEACRRLWARIREISPPTPPGATGR